MVRYGPKGWAKGEEKMGKRGMYPRNLLLHNPPAFVYGLKLRNIKTTMQASSFRVSAQIPTVNKDSMAESTVPKWAQKTVSLPPLRRGCHLVTSKVPFPLLPSLFLFPKP